jgi:transposase
MTKVLYVGLDIHKESIVPAIAPAGDTAAELYSTVGGTLDALDKFIKKLTKPNLELRFVYEAGPCGCVIYRHLKQRQYHCEVIAPSLIPTKASDRVKTDRRDARQLARLFRAGELRAIYVPDAEDEAMRDLVRARDRLPGKCARENQCAPPCGLRPRPGPPPPDVNTRWTAARGTKTKKPLRSGNL